MLPQLFMSPEVAPIGAPLHGVLRPGGRVSDAEDSTGVRRRAKYDASVKDGATRLAAVAAQLRGPSSAAASLSRRWQAAVRTSMANKVMRYERERAALQVSLERAGSGSS